MHEALDEIVERSLRQFAKKTLQEKWWGKEHDWVNLYTHGYLTKYCKPGSPLYDPGQIGIEVGVPQPPGYKKKGVLRDIVIWRDPGTTCWDSEWKAVRHPLAILEWKVHRPGRRNREVHKEREWLRQYCAWQQNVVAYAIEVDTATKPSVLRCTRFYGETENQSWLNLEGVEANI
ncbi:MAG: hypothetical protein BVN29_06785 [Nitrospira sp. ST-bin5]|nr:MAG: hypothetical protein BVN29_06785 [Nitrospira sp. ST-bin5]